MNLYQYCGNNPLNWTDPTGEFRFGKRSLGGVWGSKNYTKIPSFWPLRMILDNRNIGIYHEHGFFEDGSHKNNGYFGPEKITNPKTGKVEKVYVGIKNGDNCASKGEDPDDYDISPYQYDDAIMRQAIKNVNGSGQFDPEDYKLMGRGKNNCQDYKTALKKEYKRLGGEIKYRPFGKRKYL